MNTTREQWDNRLGFFGLSFVDSVQIYPRPRDKKHGGNVQPSAVITTEHNQLENDMETQLNGTAEKTNKTDDLTPEKAAKIADDLTAELKRSRTVSARCIGAAVVASGVAVGAGLALTVHHLVTRK